MKVFRYILFLSLLASGTALTAQVYPVQVTTQITPPYSLYLADYVAPGSERLALNVYLADATRPQLDVKFRLRIIGNGITIETKPEYLPPPISLHGGVPQRLISADLAGYFEPKNLNFTGISQSEYEQKGSLPEGIYQFCFEVLEYHRGVKISNTGCVTAWLILNDPPLINLPVFNDKVRILTPQNLVFQWTPRHTGSPNSAFTTEYDFQLVEVWPATRNANDAILTSPPIYQTTTNATTLIYGPAETALEPGRTYAFRVRARSMVGVDQLDLFKNNGYSQVSTFTYGDACNVPGNIQAQASSTHFGLQWDEQPNQTGFTVRYRPAGDPNAEWFTNTAVINTMDVTALSPATTYEYEVSATCGSFDGPYSTVATVTTSDAPLVAYSCGIPMQTFNLDPSQLAPSLKVGDIIKAGDFDVKISKVTGSAGSFTGEGIIVVPLMNNVKVKAVFNNIAVSTDNRMVQGFMEVTGAALDVVPDALANAMDQLSEVLDVADSALSLAQQLIPPDISPDTFVADTLIHITGTIASVQKDDNGNVSVTTTDGKTIPIPKGTPTALTDDSGKGYLVDDKGNHLATTASIAAATANREYNLKLHFAQGDKTPGGVLHGFDDKKIDVLASQYQMLKGGYYVPWKAIESGQTDKVKATTDGSFDSKNIQFKNGSTNITATASTGKSQSLTLTGSTHGAVEEVMAFYVPQDTAKEKTQVLGKLNVVNYDKVSNHLVIVQVNNAKYNFSLKTLTDSLNAIYGQAVAEWDVKTDSITIDSLTTLDDGSSGLLSNYTGGMKNVINAYTDNHTLDDKTYYLFLISKSKSGTTMGYMPRSKQAGFIFLDATSNKETIVVNTIAHELGHGAFTLQHTFAEYPTMKQGTTNNLMDYNNGTGTKLWKYQWDRVHDPVTVIGLFESDAAGESVVNLLAEENIIDLSNIPISDGCKSSLVLLPSNVVAEIDSKTLDLIQGQFQLYNNRLLSFKIGEIVYTALNIADTKNDIFQGSAPSYYFADWESIKKVTNDGKSGITSSEIKDDKNQLHTVYAGILGSTYVIRLNSHSKCEGESVIGSGSGCYTVLKSDCTPGTSTDASSATADGNTSIINLSKSISADVINKALSQLNQINTVGLMKARIIVTDNNTADKVNAVAAIVKGIADDEIIVWVDFDKDGKLTSIQFYYGKNYQSLTELQKIINGAFGNVQVTSLNFNPLTAILDGLSYLIGKLKIPERFYDPDQSDYNSVLADMYYYASVANPISNLSQSLLSQIPNVTSGKDDKYAAHRVELAFYCGVWNGLVDQVQGLPGLASWAIKMITNEKSADSGVGARDEFIKNWDQFKKDCETNNTSATYAGCGWDLVWGGIKKHHTSGGPCAISAQIGSDVANLATFFLAFAKVGALAKVSQLFEALDVTTYLFRGAGYLVRFVVVIPGKYAYRLAKSTIYLVIETTNNAVVTGFKILDATTQDALYTIGRSLDDLLADQSYAVLQQGDLLIFGADQIPLNAKISEILDNSGQRIQDSFGNYLSEMRSAGQDGLDEIKVVVTKVRGGGQVVDLTQTVYDLLRKRLADLDENARAAFMYDFGGKADMLAAFTNSISNSQLDLIDGWNLLYTAGISQIRTEPGSIANALAVLKKAPSDVNASDIAAKIGKSDSKRDFIETLANATDDVDFDEILGGVVAYADAASKGATNAITVTSSVVDGLVTQRKAARLAKDIPTVGNLSEQIAEAAADSYYLSKPNAKQLKCTLSGAGKQGQFDKIYKLRDGTIVIVEAKGGASPLKGRRDASGNFNQQGSTAYLQDIVNNMTDAMAGSPDVEIEATLNEIATAINNKKIQYVEFRQSFGDDGNLKQAIETQFELKF